MTHRHPSRAEGLDRPEARDEQEIRGVVETFFGAFTSGPGCAQRLDALPDLFLPGAVIVRACGQPPEAYDVPGFVEPRRRLLLDGGLTDFSEWPLDGRTEVYGDIAQHVTGYAKSGSQDGVRFEGRGTKVLQLVRTGQGWRISALAWDDEPAG